MMIEGDTVEKKGYVMKKRISFIVDAAKKYTLKLTLMLIIILVTTYIVATFPYILGKLVDVLLYDRDMKSFFNIIIVYILLFLINQFLHFMLEVLRADLSSKFIYSIKRNIFSKVLSYKCEALASIKSGDVVSRISRDTNEVMGLFHSDIFYGISAAFDFLACMSMMLMANVSLAFITMFLSIISFGVSKYYSNKLKPFQKDIVEKSAENSAWLYEVLGGMRDIKLLGIAKNCIKMYLNKDIKLIRFDVKRRKYEVKAEKCNLGIQTICTVSLYGVSALLILSGNLTVGGMVACIDYFNRMTILLERISKRFITLPERLVAVDRIMEIWDVDSEDYQNGSLEISGDGGNIDMQNVSFSYRENNKVLNNISFSIKKGEKVAIVGKSGEGKSTIANLLCRFYEPQSGSICVDGVDIQRIKLHSLRQQIGIAHQETRLFNNTIRYNLIFSDLKDHDSEIWEALKKAELYDFVKGLAYGLDTIIGLEGSTLSGGQRQRLVIARLFLRKPTVIVFDESTSSLDSITEMEVVENWNKIFEGRTMLVIAHRFSTIKNVDKVICLQNGEIVGNDTHENLLLYCEAYKKLYFGGAFQK